MLRTSAGVDAQLMMVIIFNIVVSINLNIMWIPLRIMGITE